MSLLDGDLFASSVTAVASGGGLWLVARWLWNYQQNVTDRYEKRLGVMETEAERLRSEVDSERAERRAAQDFAARCLHLLRQHGIDTPKDEATRW